MKRFRYKMLLVFIIFMVISSVGIGLFTAKNLKDTHIQTMQESLFREMHLILAAIPWRSDLSLDEQIDYFEEQVAYLKQFTSNRITFINTDGVVLGDSEIDARSMDNHRMREEIIQAIDQAGPATSIRFSESVQQNMLNVAVPVVKEGITVGYLRLGMSLEIVETAIKKLWSYYLIGFTLLFLLSVAVSYWISRGLVRPLEKITKVAEQITDGNYLTRVTIRNKDEIGKLADAINMMAESLNKQMQRIAENEHRLTTILENMISGIVIIDSEGQIVLMNKSAENILGIKFEEWQGKPIVALKHFHPLLMELVLECMHREPIREESTISYPEERTLELSIVPLEQAGDWEGTALVLHDITAIRRLEKIRSEFVANVSHELKTPIASVKGFAETLLSGRVQDSETVQSFLQIIYDESERLNRLIVDILDLSKIEAKETPLNFSPIELKQFVQDMIKRIQSEADKKQINVDYSVPSELYIEADEDRLGQVLINLLTNGIHYTSEGGRVLIEVIPLPESEQSNYDKVRINVTDTGMGIPKKDIPRIFERFYRVDKARSRRSGGTGLGLSIVKHIVDLHRGQIFVHSEVGVGTTFSIELPIIQSHDSDVK